MMKTKVKIYGLDCPNCARNLQNEINKLEGVKNASIDFVKCTLCFESENPQESMERISTLTKQLEPQAKLSEKQSSKVSLPLMDILMLVLGVCLGIFIFFYHLPVWLYWILYSLSALLLGYKTYIRAVVLLFRGTINENLLITISVVGASVISEHMEGLMVIALYSTGKIFEGLAVNRSRKSIEKLARMQPEYANLFEKGKEKRVAPNEVAIGSIIFVHPGEKVPIDGIIVSGKSMIDNQSLTGESVPVTKSTGDEILSGGIVLDGTLKIRTSSLYKDSAISKIMNLVENANENKSKTETFISKLTKWYTLGVVLCAILVWGIVWGVSHNFETAFYRGLIFLVVSCPCAFAISVPLSYFSGLGNASKNGILIKGSNYLDACSMLKLVAFDKTGTLTTGKFEINKIIAEEDYTKEEVLYYASLGEQHSLHPLAKAITSECDKKLPQIKNFREIAGSGVEYTFRKNNYFVGRKSKDLKSTSVEVYKNNKKMGVIELSDTIKPTSKKACKQLEQMGVETALLSGDNQEIANAVSEKLEVKQCYANLLPEEKYEFLENCKTKNIKVGYVGDGINDAPSLAISNVGFSMGINGAPASIEASDIVIVDDNPQKIATAIKISRHTRKIVWENIILSAVTKVTFLILGAVGVTGMLSAVFADVGVTLLAILNSLRALYHSPNKK